MKKHMATAETRRQVEAASGYGLRHDQIGGLIGVSGRTVERSYGAELKAGAAKALAQVARALFSSAVNGNTTAQIFYLKTQGGWKETQRIETTGPDGAPLTPAPTGVLVVPGMQTLEQWEADSAALLTKVQKPEK